MNSEQTIKIIVSGKVQGVFYRQHTKETALALNIKGTVRNLNNGDVEVIATASKDRLDQLIIECKKGPWRAEVKSLLIEDMPLTYFQDFSIIR